jgi:rod shape-determining protein MreC
VKALFVRKSGAGYLFTALVLLSVVMIVLETTTRLLEPVRQALASVLAPVHFAAELPYLASGGLGEVVASRESLRDQAARQEQQVLELSHVAQQYQALKTENERLRALLGSRSRLPSAVLITELVGVVPAPETHQIIIDKGSADGVRAGAPVIDAYGLFGQIVETARHTSRVLLVTDANHAVPVQINRNGVRSIAGGTGDPVYLELENVPITADVTEGDLVETSGLGGGFPAGYPVGRIASVRIEATAAFAIVQVEPMAELDRSRHLLVILNVPQPASALPAIASSGAATAAPPVTPAVAAPGVTTPGDVVIGAPRQTAPAAPAASAGTLPPATAGGLQPANPATLHAPAAGSLQPPTAGSVNQ